MNSDPKKQELDQAIVAAYPGLLQYAQQLTRNSADARDLVHEAIERGLAQRARFQSGTAASRWLATILRCTFIDRYRRARVAAQVARRWNGPTVVDPFADDEGGRRSRWQDFSVGEVRVATTLLAPGVRQAYVMFTFDQLSQAEIARRLEVAPATVATRISRARLRLRQLLTSGELRVLSLVERASAQNAARVPRSAKRSTRRRGARVAARAA
jgi:RNA polymerase sigma factor (sigma-70 family)